MDCLRDKHEKEVGELLVSCTAALQPHAGGKVGGGNWLEAHNPAEVAWDDICELHKSNLKKMKANDQRMHMEAADRACHAMIEFRAYHRIDADKTDVHTNLEAMLQDAHTTRLCGRIMRSIMEFKAGPTEDNMKVCRTRVQKDIASFSARIQEGRSYQDVLPKQMLQRVQSILAMDMCIDI